MGKIISKLYIGILACISVLFFSGCAATEPPIPFYLYILKEGDYYRDGCRYIGVDSNGKQLDLLVQENEGVFFIFSWVTSDIENLEIRKLLDIHTEKDIQTEEESQKCVFNDSKGEMDKFYDEESKQWLFVPLDKVDEYLLVEEPVERRIEIERDGGDFKELIRPYMMQIKKSREKGK